MSEQHCLLMAFSAEVVVSSFKWSSAVRSSQMVFAGHSCHYFGFEVASSIVDDASQKQTLHYQDFGRFCVTIIANLVTLTVDEKADLTVVNSLQLDSSYS